MRLPILKSSVAALLLLVMSGCRNDLSHSEAPAISPEDAAESAAAELDAWSELLGRLRDGQATEIVCDYPVSDQQIVDLPADLPIEQLILERGSISRVGLESLERFASLRRLDLRECEFGDAEAAVIARFAGLRSLNVPKTHLTSEGVRELGKLQLVSLRLGSDRITVESAGCFSQLQGLKHLHLIGIPLNRLAIAGLAEMETLQSLYLDDARLSEEDVGWLVEQRPDLHIHLDQAHPDR